MEVLLGGYSNVTRAFLAIALTVDSALIRLLTDNVGTCIERSHGECSVFARRSVIGAAV